MQNKKSLNQKQHNLSNSVHSSSQHIKIQSNTRIKYLFQNLKEEPSYKTPNQHGWENCSDGFAEDSATNKKLTSIQEETKIRREKRKNQGRIRWEKH